MEVTDVAVDVKMALGSPIDGPVFVGSDNLANALQHHTPNGSRPVRSLRKSAGFSVSGTWPSSARPALTRWMQR
jgi:hypothetical protein